MKGKLTQSEKYIIDGMMKDGKTAEEIAAFTGRSLAVIQKYLTKDVPQPAEIKTDTVKISSKPLFARQNGATIMTQAASERGDDFRKKGNNLTSRTSKGNIYIIDKQEINND